MIDENDVRHIAELADVTVTSGELKKFTSQFNTILEYFDTLDCVEGVTNERTDRCNNFREDEVTHSLPQEELLANASEKEEGFFKAPKVM